jgi:acetylornithine deacetylase/succinyl-diaminopimelate desuccinylase-like protein
MGLRGIIHVSVELSGPLNDLHSGVHGGIAPNPAAEIAKLIASLHNPDGSIAVEGFYDSLAEPTHKEKQLIESMEFSDSRYEKETGVPPVAGEKQFSPPERAGFRPSIDVNGIHSGYDGHGIKTIIPAHASAKITSRLAAGQDPEFCLDAVIRHLRDHAPKGLELKITDKGIGGPGFRLNPDARFTSRAKTVMDQLTDKETVYLWEGASIPIVAELINVSEAEPLLAGFGSEADNMHAPNESFSLEQFRLGYLYAGMMLSSVSEME